MQNSEGMQLHYQRLQKRRYYGKKNVFLMPKKIRNELISLHEAFYPKEKDTLEQFFRNFIQDTTYDFSDDIANIKYIIYTAETCYRVAIMNSLPYIQLVQLDAKPDKVEMYNFNSNKIYIKLGNRKDMKKEAYPYGVFFHELSHAVDDVSCMDIFLKIRHSVDFYTNETGEKLQDIARREIRERILKSIHEIVIKKKMNMDEKQINLFLEILFSRVTEVYPFENENMKMLYQELRKEYGYSEYDRRKKVIQPHLGTKHPLYRKKYKAVTDVIGGYTGNSLGAVPCGHFSLLYWYNLFGSETKRQSRELWAEYSSYLIIGDGDGIRGTEQYFPESCAFIRHIWREIIR
ncbi:MAG: hypothetical protein ACI4DU_03860 [Lachnospiraceae bacterium]